MISPANPLQQLNGNDFNSDDVFYMQHALQLARQAETNGEVPIGAVIVSNQIIIGGSYNQPISKKDPTAHAEVLALRAAAFLQGNYRLVNTRLYVTLEPCMMCVGAMLHARVDEVIFAAYDPKMGMLSNQLQLSQKHCFNHQLSYRGGLLGEESASLLKQFFLKKRKSSQF